jgi:hypothetical protein
VKEYNYSGKSTDRLMEIVAEDKPTSPRHMAASRELEKREHGKWRKRLLIKVSIMVIVGIILLLCRSMFHR